MYKRHKWLAFFIFLSTVLLSIFLDLGLSKDLVAGLITFFSVVFGFYMTAVSIVFGSNYAKRLRSEEDPIIRTKTKLHTLVYYFKFSSSLSIISIISLLLCSVSYVDIKSTPLGLYMIGLLGDYDFFSIVTASVFGLVAVNILFLYLVSRIFFISVIEEGGH